MSDKSDDYRRGYEAGIEAPIEPKARFLQVMSLVMGASDDFIRGYGQAVQDTGNGYPLEWLEERIDRATKRMRKVGVGAKQAADALTGFAQMTTSDKTI